MSVLNPKKLKKLSKKTREQVEAMILFMLCQEKRKGKKALEALRKIEAEA